LELGTLPIAVSSLIFWILEELFDIDLLGQCKNHDLKEAMSAGTKTKPVSDTV
jgi:hypothetical protein